MGFCYDGCDVGFLVYMVVVAQVVYTQNSEVYFNVLVECTASCLRVTVSG
jgi:hypothetical protein